MTVEASLRVAPLPDGAVPRHLIVDRLVGAPDVPVVLVQGPPGSGKTTTVQLWAHADDRPFTWLVLDEADNDPSVLATHLMLALLGVERAEPAAAALLADTDVGLDTVIQRLQAAVEHHRHAFVLAADCAEVLDSLGSVEVLSRLIDVLPPHSQLVLIARRPPRLDWSALRVQRRLTEIDYQALRMSSAEAGALLSAMGLDLSVDEVESLVRRTEGWTAGLCLAGRSLSARGDQRRAVEAFRGSEQHVATYLRDHVLAGLPQRDQTFLTQMSILNRMSGPVCDYVLQTTASAERLRRLGAANVLLFPADREHTWFRLHPLLGEALRAEAAEGEPHAIEQRYGRASQWLEANSSGPDAIDMAVAAGQTTRAARLIWQAAGEHVAIGDLTPMEARLDAFSSRQIAGHAKLALTAAWCSLLRGRAANHWVSAAEDGSYDADVDGEAESVAAGVALLRGVLAQDGLGQMVDDARAAIRLQEPGDLWRCTALLLEAQSLCLSGSPDAERRLSEVVGLAQALGARLPEIGALVQLASLALDADQWPVAEECMEDCFELMGHQGLDQLPSSVLSHCVMAAVAAHRGDEDRARGEIRQSIDMLKVSSGLPAWVGVQGRYLLARSELMLGDDAAARRLLSEGMSLTAGVADGTVLRETLRKWWRQAREVRVGLEHGASTLTSAELRVLQYLPTHLSFELIGAELHVSRNTVKSQSIAVYRKLGVTSRAEAVERARALGLIRSG